LGIFISLALALARSSDEDDKATTSTPSLRMASTWAGPMKPTPITPAQIFFTVKSHPITGLQMIYVNKENNLCLNNKIYQKEKRKQLFQSYL
jgi:hypothetical protein